MMDLRFYSVKILTAMKDRLKIGPSLGAVFLCLLMAGCGIHDKLPEVAEFFEEKPTELESRAILNEISQIRENPNIANVLPERYRQPSRRLKVDDGVKLFYFSRHHSVGDLTYRNDKNKGLEKQIHGMAGTLQDLGFKVSSNPSTNQLIIHCTDDAECDQMLAYLKQWDVPPIQVHIDCLILERFGDVTKDWEATILIENFLGEGITLGADKYPGSAFPGASLRESRRNDFGLDFGYWMNKDVPGHRVRAVVDILESRGYLKILLNPTLEVVNGKTATVTIRDNAPIERTVTTRGGGGTTDSYTLTDYKWVADNLTVTPHVYADGTIGLRTSIVIGSKSKPEGVVQTSIITERSIRVEENRIDPGKSLIIGGMRKSENRSVVRGVPFLKDIPVLGILFSSKDFEEKATEIIFILTPSISSGSVPYEQTADMIRKKYETPEYDTTLDEVVSDPLGTGIYTEMVEEQVGQARAGMVKAQMDAEEARRLAAEQRQAAEQAREEARRLEAFVKRTREQIQQANQQLEQAQAQAQQDQQQRQTSQQQLAEAQQQLAEAQRHAEEARQKAQQSQKNAEAAEQKAGQLQQQADEARKNLEQIRQQQDALTTDGEPTPPSQTP